MVKTKKDLLTSAPWRADPQETDEKFKDARLKVTSQPGTTPTMHVPGKKKAPNSVNDEESLTEIDPELRYSFQRNFQVLHAQTDTYKSVTAIMEYLLKLPGVQHENPPTAGSFLQRVFSVDTVVKPLPPAMAYNVSRNLTFFTRIFTQFFDPEGIANAQKSLGLGQEEKARNVR